MGSGVASLPLPGPPGQLLRDSGKKRHLTGRGGRITGVGSDGCSLHASCQHFLGVPIGQRDNCSLLTQSNLHSAPERNKSITFPHFCTEPFLPFTKHQTERNLPMTGSILLMRKSRH